MIDDDGFMETYSIRCPRCGEPPGNEEAMVFFPDGGPWSCVSCGDTFDSPSLVPAVDGQEV